MPKPWPAQFTVRTLLVLMTATALFCGLIKGIGIEASATMFALLGTVTIGIVCLLCLEWPITVGAVAGAICGPLTHAVLYRIFVSSAGPRWSNTHILAGAVLGVLIADLIVESRMEPTTMVGKDFKKAPWPRLGWCVAARWHWIPAWVAGALLVVEMALLGVGLHSLPPNDVWQRIVRHGVQELRPDGILGSACSLRSLATSVTALWSVYAMLCVSLFAAGLVRYKRVDHPAFEQRLLYVGVAHALAVLLFVCYWIGWFVDSLAVMSGTFWPGHQVSVLLWMATDVPPCGGLLLLSLLVLGKHTAAYWRQCGWLLIPAAVAMVDVIVGMTAITYLLHL